MNTQDFLTIVLSLGIMIVVVSLSVALFSLTALLRSVNNLLRGVEETTREIINFKEEIKLGALNTISSLLGILIKKRR